MKQTTLRYMIDTETYKILHQSDEQLEDRDELDDEAMNMDEPPEYPFVYLLPARIRGFAFKGKKWSE